MTGSGGRSPDNTVDVLTFGCRLNAYESEVIRRNADTAGLRDAVIVNSCAVTAEAERQVRQAIRRARRDRPDARIVVTGCAAQIDPDAYAAMDEVDAVIGNREKLDVASFLPDDMPAMAVNDIMSVRDSAEHLIDGFDGRARAFVEIQQGCDHRCTFCIIPFGRGNNRSVPMGTIVDRIRALVKTGYAEIVLTGVDITDYGRDLPGQPSLGQLTRRLLAAVPELPRLRLSSLDPAELDKAFYRAVAEEDRLMPHFHISVQSGDDMILKRMKRRHSRADVLDFCDRVRSLRPDAAFGADLIAGFPTETDAMHANSMALIAEAGISFVHVFPYSARPGTPAAKMPQVPGDVRKARAAELRSAGAEQLDHFLDSRIGLEASVLIEQDGHGRSEHYAEVRCVDATSEDGIARVILTGRDGNRLIAKRAA